tara:strand:- start:56 stop:409 length:354 start_codon:yes stop_codon:yes gene_type:complete
VNSFILIGEKMPTENRNIHFTENEVKIALMQFSARKGLKFNTDNINEFSLVTDGAISIALKVFDVAANQAGTINYAHPEIAAALMGYCMHLKIPLPKAGKKSLKSNDQGLFLNIRVQ